jgi:cytochrome c-type biogenesis protein CcsB
MFRLLTFGVVLHVVSFGVRLHDFWIIPENRYFVPINTFYGSLSYMSLTVALTFAIVEGRYRLGILGAFVLPWACLGAVSALLRAASVGSTEILVLNPTLRSYWMNLHPMALMTAYSIFGNAFGVGLALLVQEYQIKSRRPSELCYRLPAIEELDSLNYGLVAFGFPVLFSGIAMGVLWAHAAWGRFWLGDAKVVWALITAMVYGTYLWLRFQAGWRGRKAVYMSMLGFACVVFTFAAVNFISQMHDYL